MTNDQQLQEFAAIFRCSLDMAPVYIGRIHERMGTEVPMDNIFAAMKKIAPKKLSMDTIIAQLKKMERNPSRRRAVKPDDVERGAEDNPGEVVRSKPRASRPKASAEPRKMTALDRVETILVANWERGRKHGLKPPALSAEQFVKSAQSIAGAPKPSVARVMQAILKLDKRNVLLTPNLVADEINESDET